MRGEYNMLVTMAEFEKHWTEIHASKDKDVSWWQDNLWLDFLDYVSISGAAIDVGSGQSQIAIELAKAGFEPVYINDLAINALSNLVQTAASQKISLVPITGSVVEIEIPTKVNLWHDRAVFHFLTSDADIAKYKSKVAFNIKQHGHLVIATFSENGPTQCSGLEVRQYSPQDLVHIFQSDFEEIFTTRRLHRTPWDSEQEFSIAILRKNSPISHGTKRFA